MIAREQQFAEKIHAYTMPRPVPNSRVRDLVDLHLLIASGSLDVSLCTEALRRTFARRNTHELPNELVPPPADWDRPFQVLPNSALSTLDTVRRLIRCSVSGPRCDRTTSECASGAQHLFEPGVHFSFLNELAPAGIGLTFHHRGTKTRVFIQKPQSGIF